MIRPLQHPPTHDDILLYCLERTEEDSFDMFKDYQALSGRTYSVTQVAVAIFKAINSAIRNKQDWIKIYKSNMKGNYKERIVTEIGSFLEHHYRIVLLSTSDPEKFFFEFVGENDKLLLGQNVLAKTIDSPELPNI